MMSRIGVGLASLRHSLFEKCVTLFVELAMCRPVTMQRDATGVSFDRLFTGLESK
jgi:hypothetical protein